MFAVGTNKEDAAMKNGKFHIETLAIHAGQDAHGDSATCARAVPVYRTTAYNFRDSRHGADLFGQKIMVYDLGFASFLC